jgi:hypothetical protein
MQFFGGKTQKVHYSAVFGDGKIKAEKTKIKALNTETQRKTKPNTKSESRSLAARGDTVCGGGRRVVMLIRISP